ncbi:MAG TPA: hypothetical protein VFM32_03145 [Spongiibacteraceae bacterium]|nr:hypothetical protein [Spongiibacteraceae bacterium]
MTKRKDPLHPDAPLKLNDHRRPRTRREFIAQSFAAGSGLVIASSLAGLFSSRANAALSSDLQTQLADCAPSGSSGGPMIPFICFDLAGGANIAGSNVLVGYKGGQQDFISTSGYSMLGLPAGMAPNAPGVPTTSTIDTSLGLAFHADSAFLRGIKTTCSVAAMANTNGAVIPARSENDTGNNPHNPMYAIYRAGATGDLVNLIGSQNSDSGGNSMAPATLIDIKARPTQVARPSDVTAIVGSSNDVPPVLDQSDTVMAMESIVRVSNTAIDHGETEYYLGSGNTTERANAKCEILKSADSTDKFGGANSPDPSKDQFIIGNGGALGPIFTSGLSSDSEYLKTASIMKLVVDGVSSWPSKRYASAGTITMGGFDYHTGDRSTGEARDFRAGQCMGACLEYAHRKQVPVMIYVFSDGALSSNGAADMSAGGRGKNNWDSDNQATGAAFFLVYNPTGRATLLGATDTERAVHQQLGWMRTDGSVDTMGSPGANSVTQLVDMVVLNYLALQGNQSLLSQALAGRAESSILGGPSNWNKYTAFAPLS